jgi:transcriptional regulator with XRE-family HTH domain
VVLPHPDKRATRRGSQTLREVRKAMPLTGLRLGDAIKELREAKGWNQSELADRAETTQAQISKIERGEAKGYGEQMLLSIAGALGVRPYELFAKADGVELVAQQRLTRDEKALLAAYAKLGDEQRKMVQSVILTLIKAP